MQLTLRLPTVILAGVAALAVGVLALASRDRPAAGGPAARALAQPRRATDAATLARARADGAFGLPAAAPATVELRGTVHQRGRTHLRGGVALVVRDEAGRETPTTAAADGSYAVRVPPGRYRIAVRDPHVMMVVPAARPRLPAPPTAALAGALDDEAAPAVEAWADVAGLDLPVVSSGRITGTVHDPGGAPVAGAIVVAHGAVRPVVATHVAVTDAQGGYALQVPPGDLELGVSHAAFAGLAAPVAIAVRPGARLALDLALARGCIIRGRVVDHRGRPAADGAIERKGELGTFQPAAQVAGDGTFTYAAVGGPVTLRAWPWGAPHSDERTWACRDGARHDDVVLRLPDARPDLEGELRDADGAPVPLAALELIALDADGLGQQERTDAAGRWRIYRVPPGRYLLRAQAPGRGVTSQRVTAPRARLTLALGGVGQLEGTTTALARGAAELDDVACLDANGDPQPLAHAPRLLVVDEGRWRLDGVPACKLAARARWRDQEVALSIDVAAGARVTTELALGRLPARRVRGTVRDRAGRPVGGAIVTALAAASRDAVVSARADGRYELTTVGGAELRASAGARRGTALVGAAHVDEELVDVVVE